MTQKKLLLIFIKNPERGKVKTRLAQTVGDEKAYQTYLKLLDHTIEVADQVQAKKQIWYSSYIDESDGLGEQPSDGSVRSSSVRSEGSNFYFEKKLQQGDDLGERMSRAFHLGFKEGFEKILIIGSDCLAITAGIIEDGFNQLDVHDVVVGPSEDGGYYLIGSKQFIPELFQSIPWSTERVYPETIRAVEEQNLQYGVLPTLNDIDTEEDLNKSDFE